MILTGSLIGLAVAFGFFSYRRMLRYLHLFQQDDYDERRFLTWWIRSRTFDWRLSLGLLALAVCWQLDLLSLDTWTWLAAASGLIFVMSLREPNPKKEAKKPLVMTQRATTTIWVAMALLVVFLGVLFSWSTQGWFSARSVTPWLLGWLIAGVQLLPTAVAGASLILKPLELRRQRFFWNEAEQRLRSIDPEVIAVTGSFGKTSVKHLLGHVLELTARGYFTPGSINTPMGIARVIRETLPSNCSHFVVEMGAYGPGSITRLCRLTPPKVGVITAIGEAHYERFRDLDTVTRAKFELAHAVLDVPEGRVVLHESVLEQPFARDFVAVHRSRVLVCGSGVNADVALVSSDQTADGLRIVLDWQGNKYEVITPLFGLHQAGNLALTFGTCMVLGLKPNAVVAALRSAPQIKHRLEVKSLGDGSIYIDDAYNSNPNGFRSALSLLSSLGGTHRRKIVVTPGIIELGEQHDPVHYDLGRCAGKTADIVIVVRPDRIPTFVEGLRLHEHCSILTVDSFDQARQWMVTNVTAGDVVLVENDLPDLYERRFRL